MSYGKLAILTNECQNGAIGPEALWPALKEAAEGVVPALVRLLTAARTATIPVIHSLTVKREDLRSSNDNAPLFTAARRSGGLREGTSGVALVEELGPDPSDILIPKYPGMSPFPVSDLDAILRHLKVETVALTGVSLNVAIPSIAFDAVNRGYRVVVPTDAVAGVPAEYGAQMLQHSLSLVADLTTVDELIATFAD